MNQLSIRDRRSVLRAAPHHAGSRHRIMVVKSGESQRGGFESRVAQALARLGHTVFELDLTLHPSCVVTGGQVGGGTQEEPDGRDVTYFEHGPVQRVFRRFEPELFVTAGGTWDLSAASAAHFETEGIIPVCLVDDLATALPETNHGDAGAFLHRPVRPSFLLSELLRDPLPTPTAVAKVLRSGHPHRHGYRECDHAALLEAVNGHLDDTALPEDVAAQALDHLSSHHLYEHALETILHALRADDSLRDGGTQRPRTVMISGYYGAGNRGDELLLTALLDHFEENLPGFNAVVAGSKPGVVEREHGVQSFARAILDAGEHHAERSSALILGPGGHWHDYSIHLAGGAAGMVRAATVSPAHMAQLPLLVSAYGGSVHVTGMGVGPLQDVAARAAVNLTGRLARSVTVRDAPSAELLEPMSRNWPADVVVAPDVVYGLALPESGRTDRPAGGVPARPPYLAVNLRPWTDDPAQRRALAVAILQTAADRGLGIVGVPMQHTDVAALRDLAAAAPEGVDVEVLPPDLPLEEFLGVLRDAEVLVAMRLHANLLRHRLRRPALGLVYDPKVGSHFAELGRQDAALELEAAPETVRRTLESLLDEDGLPPATLAAIDDLEARARHELHRLSDALAAEPLRVPDPAWIQYLPQAPVPRANPAPAPAPVPAPAPAPDVGTAVTAAAPGTPEAVREPSGSPEAGTGHGTTAARPRRSRLRRVAGRAYRGIRRRLRRRA